MACPLLERKSLFMISGRGEGQDLEGRALEVFPHAPAHPRAWDLPLDRGGIML